VSSSSAKYDGSSNSCPYAKKSDNKGTVYAVVGSSGQLGGAQAGYPHDAMYYSNNSIGGAMVITAAGNRLDAEWVCADGVVRDQFTLMKDVNKKELHTIYLGDLLPLSASWKGSYNWTDGSITNTIEVSPPNSEVIDSIYVTDAYGCINDSFIITKALPFKETTTVAERSAKAVVPAQAPIRSNFIKVYPNPSTTGIFTIDYSSDKDVNSTIAVYDILGNVVFQDEFKVQDGLANYTLNIADLPSGNYIMKAADQVVRIQK
jgi:hypothetical protein